MSHTKLVKPSTTRARGARSRGQGHVNTHQNRRFQNTYDDSTFHQPSQNSESDNLDYTGQENRETPYRTRGHNRQHRGKNNVKNYSKNNPGSFDDSTFQQLSQHSESDNLDYTQENRGTPHNTRGQNRQHRGKNYVKNDSKNNSDYFRLDNFSESNEAESSMLGTSAVGGDSSRLPKHASNPIFVHELAHRFSSILPESDLLEQKPRIVQQRVQPNERSSVNNVFPNDKVEYGVKRGVNNNRDSWFDENVVRKYAIEDKPSYNNTQREKGRSHQSDQYHSILSRGDAPNRNDNTGAKRKLSKPHENNKLSLSRSVLSESSSETDRNDPKRRFSDDHKSKVTRNDKDKISSNNKLSNSNSGVTELLNKPQTRPYRPSDNHDLDRGEKPHSNRGAKPAGPGTQDRINIFMKYGFNIQQNKQSTEETKIPSPSSLKALSQPSQETFSAPTDPSLGSQLFAEIDRFDSSFNKPVPDSTPQKNSPKKSSNATVTSQKTSLTTNLGIQFLNQAGRLESNCNKPIPDSNTGKERNSHKNLSAPNINRQEPPLVPTLGTQFIEQADRFESRCNKPIPVSNPKKDGNPEKKNASNLNPQETPLASTLGAQFLEQVDRFAGFNKPISDSTLHQLMIGLNQIKGESHNGKNITPTKQNQQSQKTSCSFNLAGQIDNYNAFLSESSPPMYNCEQRNSGQKQRHPMQSRPSTSMLTCEELELTGRGVSGAGPFNIARPLADHNEVPIRRSDALNNLEREYEVKRREHEEKENEKLEKKRQEKLKRYNYVDNGHQGYRLSEGFLDEAAGYAPGIAQFLESEEDVRERQQLQLQIDALVYKEREEKELQMKKKKEEEKIKQKLAKNKHIDAGYKLGYVSNPASELPHFIESQEDVRQKQQEKLKMEALLLKETKIEEEKQKQKLEEEKQKQKLEQEKQKQKLEQEKQKQKLANTKLIETGRKLGSEPNLGASGGDGGDKTMPTEQDLLMQEEERLRQEALFFQQQARMAEERLRELSKRRKKSSDETRQSFETSDISQNTQSRTSGPTGDAPVLKLPQNMFKTILNEILEPEQIVPISQALTESKQVKTTATPASCVLNSSINGPVLVLRPSAVALRRAVADRIELQDEVEKLGQSALYTPNVHPEPEFINNRFDTSLALAYGGRSTGAIPKKIPKPENKIEPRVPAKIELDKADIVSSAEPVIDHQAEMRAARLRMQLKYEQQLKNNDQEAK